MVKKWRSALSVLALAAICSALIFTASTNAENAVFQAVVDEYLSLELDSTHMEVNVLPSEPFASGYVAATVNTNAAAGYTLTFQDADSRNGLERDGYDEAVDKSPFNIPSVSADTTYASLAADSWGYYLGSTTDTEATYKQIPLSATEIKTTDAPAADDASRVSFGVKIADTRPSGMYEDTLTITATANIIKTIALLDTGSTINTKLKKLNTNHIEIASELPVGFEPTEDNVISSEDAEHEVYIWSETENEVTTGYIYTDADIITMNPDSSFLFYGITMSDIDFVADWDASYVTNMSHMFNSVEIADMQGVINWNTSNVSDMSFLFNASKQQDIDDFSKWDTANATNMYATFQYSQVKNVDGAINWNTSKVTNMNQLFYGASQLENVNGMMKWDTSNVTTTRAAFIFEPNETSLNDICGLKNFNLSASGLTSTFQHLTALTSIDCELNWDYTIKQSPLYVSFPSLTNLDGLANWHLDESITGLSSFFSSMPNLENVDGLSSWDVSHVTNMDALFYDCTSLQNVDGLEGWDVSNVTSFGGMFWNNTSLADISGLAKWNIKTTATIGGMFHGDASIVDLSPLNTTQRDGYKSWNVDSSFCEDSQYLDQGMFYGVPDSVARPNWYKICEGGN